MPQTLTIFNVIFLIILLIIAISILKSRRLFVIMIALSGFSIVCAVLYLLYDAVDVSLTEAAIGSGVSTALMLATLVLTGESTHKNDTKPGFLIPFLFVVTCLTLCSLAPLMPPFGQADSISYTQTAIPYIAATMAHIDIHNVVSAILADYRAYDTLGETVVVMLAYLCVMSILSTKSENNHIKHIFIKNKNKNVKKQKHTIPRITAKFLLPIIATFAIYVQLYGESGPGGGFQAGIILSIFVIVYSLLYGFGNTISLPFFSPRWLQIQSAIGLMLYICVGLIPIFFHKPFLDYAPLLPYSMLAQKFGIFLVEVGVGITVFSASSLVFLAFIEQTHTMRYVSKENKKL